MLKHQLDAGTVCCSGSQMNKTLITEFKSLFEHDTPVNVFILTSKSCFVLLAMHFLPHISV